MTADARSDRIAVLHYDYAGQPQQRVGACNLCGGDRFVTLAHRDRYGYPAQVQGCLRCGLVFLDPVMTSDAYAEFYRNIYRPLVSAFHGRRIDAETIQSEQKVYARACGDLLEPYLTGRDVKTLLDVGGSTGVVAHALVERFDIVATVIDPAPLEVERARVLGIETVAGFVEDYDAADRRFDLVVLCQTVDHLLDVAKSLATIRSLIADAGLFFVDVVDLRAAYRRNGSLEEAIKIDHPYYLTETTTRAYLRRAGFEILQVDYAADHLHIGYVCAPGSPDDGALVAPDAVAAQWREIRAIQNPLP